MYTWWGGDGCTGNDVRGERCTVRRMFRSWLCRGERRAVQVGVYISSDDADNRRAI